MYIPQLRFPTTKNMKTRMRISLLVCFFIVVFTDGCRQGTFEENVTSTPSLKEITYPTPRVYPFNQSENFIHLAWFYKPPKEENLPLLVQNFDFFILTHKDEETRDKLDSIGVDSPIFQYLLLTQIRRPDNCNDGNYGNQVAYKSGDFCLMMEQHPDWFLLDDTGNPIHNDKTYFMDPGNSEYRTFWLQRAREMQTQYKWDGLFIDNVDASLSKFERMGKLPKKYPNDTSYQTEIDEFLSYLQKNNDTLNGNLVLGNIISVKDNEIWLKYINKLDGAMIESFAVDWSSGYKSVSDWEDQMNKIEMVLNQGKILILVSQGSQDNANREQFALASYLLVSNGNAAFRYTNSSSYGEVWLYENFQTNLGSPLGSRYHKGNAWRRDFSNGYVLVDPKLNVSQIVITE